MGAYLPAKEVAENKRKTLVEFLRQETRLYPEYIDEIEQKGHLPGKIETNYDGWERQPWFQAWLEQLSPKKRSNPFQGAKERRRVPLDPVSMRKSVVPHPMLPSDAETIAGSLAMCNCGIEKSKIDLVVVASQVPDHPLPLNACLVQDKLKLPHPGAYSVDTCCSSFVTALEIAEGLVMAGIKRGVLVIASYIDSHCTDKSEYFSVDTGDGAVAGIVTQVEPGFGYLASHSTSHGNRHPAIIFEKRSPKLLVRTAYTPSYEQDFTTFADPELCKEIATNMQKDMVEVADLALKKAKMTVSDLDFLVTHQPVAWAANAWREAIGVPPGKFYETFEQYGNIACCAAATNFCEALEKGLLKAGNRAMLASSGAGENHIAVLEKVSPQLIGSQSR